LKERPNIKGTANIDLSHVFLKVHVKNDLAFCGLLYEEYIFSAINHDFIS
jgi:hypothetical protein